MYGTKATRLLPVFLMLILPAQVFSPALASVCIIITSFFALFCGWIPWRIVDGSNRWVYALMALLWIICLLRVPLSGHIEIAWRSVETKLPMLFLPSLFSFGLSKIDEPDKSKPFLWLLVAVTISTLLGGMLSLQEFYTELYCRKHGIILPDYPYWNVFFSSRLAHFMHPGYFAVYMLTSLLALSIASRRNWIALLLPLTLIGFGLVFLASKTSFIICIILLAYYLFNASSTRHGNVMKGLFLVLFSVTVWFSSQLPWVREGVSEVFRQNIDKPEEHSTGMRISSWRASLTIMMSNFGMGAGPGDTEFAFEDQYRKYGMVLSAEKRLNAHNQVLQSAAMFGVPGLLLNLILLALIAIKGWINRRDIKSVLLAVSMVVFSNTEAIFETQAGVIWFSFALAALFHFPKASVQPVFREADER